MEIRVGIWTQTQHIKEKLHTPTDANVDKSFAACPSARTPNSPVPVGKKQTNPQNKKDKHVKPL